MKSALLLFLGLLCGLPTVTNAGVVTVISSGFTTPETITPIPSGFGTVGGDLMISDAGAFGLYVVPAGGGAPTLFASCTSGPAGCSSGGVFLPSTFGPLAGDYLSGLEAFNGSGGEITLGVGSGVADVENNTLAPSGFGSVGGEVLIAGQLFPDNYILALSPAGAISQFALIGGGGVVAPFGLGFAPAGFGADGGDLFVTDGASGNIYNVDSSGNVSLFAAVPDPPGDGLRQLAFAPAGFGSYGGDLFVSVAGSHTGGGTSGSVDVLNSSGVVIAVLMQGIVGAPFDPRGLYFASDSQLLIADTDPSILSAPPVAFTATPEPATATPAALGLLAILAASRRGLKHAR